MAFINIRIYRLLSVADAAIALLLTFPITCMYWRGIWDLIGWYVLPTRKPLKYWVDTCVGLLQMVGLMCLPLISNYLNPTHKLKFWIITRTFMYVHTLTYMFYWHGLWELLNWYFPTTWEYNVATLAIGWASLMLIGGCRSTMWPPFFIVCDTTDLFQCASRFGSQPKRGIMMDYISDAFIAQIIALGIAILCWRSAFNIMDDLLYPDSKLKSDATAAVIGLCGCVAFLSLQVPLGCVSMVLRRSPYIKVLYEDAVYLVVFIFLSLMWRGTWNLNAEYMIKELPLGGWVNHVCGTVGLMGMQTFGEVSAFGMLRDGTDPGGEAFFPVKYLRHYFKGWYSQEELGETPQTLDPDIHGNLVHGVYLNATCMDIDMSTYPSIQDKDPDICGNLVHGVYLNATSMDIDMSTYPSIQDKGMPVPSPSQVTHALQSELHPLPPMHDANVKAFTTPTPEKDELTHKF